MEAEDKEETHSHGAGRGRDNRSSRKVQANSVRNGVEARKLPSRWVTGLIPITVPAQSVTPGPRPEGP